MQPDKTIMRQRLDQRLLPLGVAVGARPPSGWLREIRLALSMSTVELAARMNISQSRASRLESAEVEETIRLSTLRGAAAALGCRLYYVLVPEEALEDMVLRQAHRKATQEMLSDSNMWAASDERFEEDFDEKVEVRTLELVDRQGLWLERSPQGRKTLPTE